MEARAGRGHRDVPVARRALLGGMLASGLVACSHAPRTQPQAGRTILAHYVPVFPSSFDNLAADRDYYATQYLQVAGEGGRYRRYGGYLRDRPLPVPVGATTWEVDNCLREIQTAARYGIQGFAVDIMSLEGDAWRRVQSLYTAADRHGAFSLLPLLDLTSIGSADPVTVAKSMAALCRASCSFVMSGQHVVGAYRPEVAELAWWRRFLAALADQFGAAVRFEAILLDPSPTNVANFATLAKGIGSWGARSPEQLPGDRELAQRVKGHGCEWISSAAFQDYRPATAEYLECRNTETLRGAMGIASELDARWVQLVSWNDFAESTAVRDSLAHPSGLLELIGALGASYRAAPAGQLLPSRGLVVVSQRTQSIHASSRLGDLRPKPTIGGYTTTPIDRLEVVVSVPQAATVAVSQGSLTQHVHVSPGISELTYALAAGAVSVELDSSAGRARAVLPAASLTTADRFDLTYHVACARV